ncbi:hypothetical protein GCM10007342_10870 [Staphylococcus pragensis]|nr:hypothetical protein GCM10007342_10870 [Staphylococcus pragensis]
MFKVSYIIYTFSLNHIYEFKRLIVKKLLRKKYSYILNSHIIYGYEIVWRVRRLLKCVIK